MGHDAPLAGPVLPAMRVPLERRMIIFRNTRFVYNPEVQSFQRIHNLTRSKTADLAGRIKTGLAQPEYVSSGGVVGFAPCVWSTHLFFACVLHVSSSHRLQLWISLATIVY